MAAALRISLGLLVLSKLCAGQQQCFWPDGTDAADSYTPCSNSTTGFSACCESSEYCLDNGLCLGRFQDLYRGGCTDSSWGSDCPQYCISPSQQGQPVSMPLCEFSDSGGGADYNCGTFAEAGSTSSFCITANSVSLDTMTLMVRPDQVQNLLQSSNIDINDIGGSGGSGGSGGFRAVEMAGVGIGVGIPLLLALLLVLFLLWREKRKVREFEEQVRTGQIVLPKQVGTEVTSPTLMNQSMSPDMRSHNTMSAYTDSTGQHLNPHSSTLSQNTMSPPQTSTHTMSYRS